MKVIKIKKYDNENGGETASTVYILSPNEAFLKKNRMCYI